MSPQLISTKLIRNVGMLHEEVEKMKGSITTCQSWRDQSDCKTGMWYPADIALTASYYLHSPHSENSTNFSFVREAALRLCMIPERKELSPLSALVSFTVLRLPSGTFVVRK